LKMLLHIWCDWWMMFSMHWVSWKRWQQIATCDKNVFTELITASVDDYNQHSSHGPVAHSQMADKHGLNWQLDKIWYNIIKYMIQYDTIGTSWVWPYWIYSRLDTAAVR
jgi:predicted methyltransferase